MLTSDYIKTRFNYHEGRLYWRYDKNRSPQWNGKHCGKVAGTCRFDGRRVIRIDGKLYLAYRLIWLYFNEELPEEIDHINRDATDDNIENLRAADRHINNWNTDASGVVEVDGRYTARIMHKGVVEGLGSYGTYTEARNAYVDRRAELRGEYCG
jgi:hypothetical protein